MKKTLTLILTLILLTCSKDDTSDQPQNTTLEGGIIYTAQIVEVDVDSATSETYQGLLGDTAIELRKTTTNSLVFFLEPDFEIGDKTLTIEGFNNFKVNYTIEQTVLTETVAETIQPYFDQLAIESIALTPQNNGDKAIALIDGFNNLYATLNDQEKENISIFYKANKNLIDATITGDVNKFNPNVVTQFSRCKASIYLTGILGVFTTISTTLPFTQIATPILAVSTGVLLAKTYEHCSSLATETIKNVYIKAEDFLFNSKTSSTAISFNTDVSKVVPIELQNRTMLPEDNSSENIIISTYFTSTNDFNELVIQKMNTAINYLNTEWSLFFDITPYEEITANDTATSVTNTLTQEDFNNFTFSISGNNLSLENLEYSNGGINTTINVIDENLVTNNIEVGTLDFTYQDDFNSFSGSFDIEVYLEEQFNYKLQIGNYNPDYSLITSQITLENNDAITLPNFMSQMVRLTLDDVPVTVGEFGLSWTRLQFGQSPVSSSAVTNSNYSVNVLDATNSRNVTINLNITLTNQAYSQINGNTLNITYQQNGMDVNPGGQDVFFNTDGTYTKTYVSDGTNAGNGSYTYYGEVTAPSNQDCGSYTITKEKIGVIYLPSESGNLFIPNYIYIYNDGTYSANSTDACNNNFNNWIFQ